MTSDLSAPESAQTLPTRRQPKHPRAGRKPLLTPVQQLAVIALAELGVSYQQIAKREGISRDTIRRILKRGTNLDPESLARVKELTRNLSLDRAVKALQEITDVKLRKERRPDKLAVTAGILIDKARLLSGESTENLAVGLFLGLKRLPGSVFRRER